MINTSLDRINLLRRIGRGLFLAGVLAVTIGLCLWIGHWFLLFHAYKEQYKRTREAIFLLQNRRPPAVSKEEWDFAWGWATNVHCETFLPFQSDPAVMERFGDELNEKLREEVSLDVFEWIWDELERATPAGKRYSEKYRTEVQADLAAMRMRQSTGAAHE